MLFKLLSTKHLDPLYNNVIRFKDENERFHFFLNHCNFRLDNWDEYQDLNYEPLTDTSIVLTMSIDGVYEGSNYGYDGIVDYVLSKYNYCVGCIIDDVESYYHKFYFIKDVEVLSLTAIRVVLELDIFTTNLDILNDPVDDKVYVNRKHCKRFDADGEFLWEDAILGDKMDAHFNANVIKKVESCVFNYFKGTPPFEFNDDRYGNIGLNEEELIELNEKMNNCGWLYFFFSDKPSELFDNELYTINRCKIGNINTGMYVIALPLNDTINTFYPNLAETGTLVFNNNIVLPSIYDAFLNSTTLLAVQFSRIAPFIPFDNYSLIDENGYPLIIRNVDYYYFNETFTEGSLKFIPIKNNESVRCIVVNRMNNELFESLEILNDIPKNIFPSNNDVVNYAYEPKLWCSPYFKLGLKANDSQEYFYNPLLLKENYKVILNRTISPVNEKIYATLISDVETIYSKFNENNIGLFNTSSYELATISNVYKDWWSRNSSAMVTGLAIPLVNDTIMSAFKGASQGGVAGAIVSGVHTGINILNDFVGNQINLSNTPDSVKNQGNNGYFEYSRKQNNNSYQLMVVQYELLESEKKQVYDYYYRYGYQVNRLEIWNDLFTRSRFNYIKLADEQFISKMKINISNNIKVIVSKIFFNGLTIWEYDTWNIFKYNLTNENKEV